MKKFLIIFLVVCNIIFAYKYFSTEKELAIANEEITKIENERDELNEKYHELRALYNMQVMPSENKLR